MGKLVNNVKIPPFSSGSGKDAVLGHIQNCPWASSYALRPSGSFGYALGRHLFQNPSEKGGISAHNVRSRAVIMTVPKFCQNFSRNASGRLWEHKTPSSESLWRKILALIISPKSDHNEGKSEFRW